MKNHNRRMGKLWKDYCKDVEPFHSFCINIPEYCIYELRGMIQKILALNAGKLLQLHGYDYALRLPVWKDAKEASRYIIEDYLQEQVVEISEGFFLSEENFFIDWIYLLENFGWKIMHINYNMIDAGEEGEMMCLPSNTADMMLERFHVARDNIMNGGSSELYVMQSSRVGRFLEYAKKNPRLVQRKIYKYIREIVDYVKVPLCYYITDYYFENIENGVFYTSFFIGYEVNCECECWYNVLNTGFLVYAYYLERFLDIAEEMIPELKNPEEGMDGKVEDDRRNNCA